VAIVVDINNRLLPTIRMIPALDAFASALDNQVVYRTGYADLFIGRPYQATDKPIDVQHALAPREGAAYDNPLPAVYNELSRLAEQRPSPAAMPPLERLIPLLGMDWDGDRSYCVNNGYVKRPVVCAFQRRQGRLALPASTLAATFAGIVARAPVLNVVFGPQAPLIPGAIEASRRGEAGEPIMPSLREVMRAASAARLVVTDAWWVHDLAVGYRKPVVFLLPAALPWRNPYGLSLQTRFECSPGRQAALEVGYEIMDDGPLVVICRGGGCLHDPNGECMEGAACKAPAPLMCVAEFSAAIAADEIGRLL
jgi:hypothetical protein